ncbi:hypothetical protein C4D60_Mb10t20400 [Musa balbisiana]|uniref:Uncharacterized protein n=1 Tax=Musa balbisiana TaxID=52838 RepID=A0A4S8IYM0_MUSBA|nr:hypothetical protein C4D60_Mb10t20400 [Musa balbisiana]
MGWPSPISPKYIAQPMSSRSKARFIPHIGNRLPLGICLVPGVPLSRLDKLGGSIIVWNVKPKAMRHNRRSALAEAERVSADKGGGKENRGIKSKRKLEVLIEIASTTWVDFTGIAYEAVVVDGVDVFLLGDHVAEAAAGGILEGDAGGLGAQDAFDVVAVVELVIEPLRHPDRLARVPVLHHDQNGRHISKKSRFRIVGITMSSSSFSRGVPRTGDGDGESFPAAAVISLPLLLNVQSIRYYTDTSILVTVPLKRHRSPAHCFTADYVANAITRGAISGPLESMPSHGFRRESGGVRIRQPRKPIRYVITNRCLPNLSNAGCRLGYSRYRESGDGLKNGTSASVLTNLAISRTTSELTRQCRTSDAPRKPHDKLISCIPWMTSNTLQLVLPAKFA